MILHDIITLVLVPYNMDSKRLEFIEERLGAADFNGVSIWIKLIDLRPNDCLKRSVIQRSGTQDENSEG